MHVSAVIRSAVVDMRSNPIPLLLAFILGIIPGVISDLYLELREGLQLVAITGLFLILLEIILTQRSLAQRNLITVRHDPPRGFYPRVFGQGILWGVALLLGLMAVVVPALILFVRLSVCVPALIAEDAGVIESLKRSWTMTKGHFWVILLIFLAVSFPVILGILATVVASFVLTDCALVESVLINTTISISQLLWWFVAIEIYAQLYTSERATT
jgi:hypothetical protein